MTEDHQSSLAVRVDPNEMVRYVHDLMTRARPQRGISQSLSHSVNGVAIRLRRERLTCGGAR